MAEHVFVEETIAPGLAAVMARRGVGAERIGEALGLDAPIGPRWASGNGLTLIGTGPGAWLALSDQEAPSWPDALSGRLGALASVSDQSSAYCFWRLSGPGARRLLQRGAAIDLHPDSFGAGSAAVTVIAHIGVIIRQRNAAPTYELAAFRSYADSLRHWLRQSGAAL